MADQGQGTTSPAGDANTFGTAELNAALPANENNQAGDEGNPQPGSGWVQATPYDYNAYGVDATHDWEGNAKTYEWNGELGDIGPENPVLEVELFGEPGNRAKHGIDFSK
jgi:ATP-dependent RNA helicase DDX3X